MDRYIAELDETKRIAAVWMVTENGRRARVFDPAKHKFDPLRPAEFSGAPQIEIVNWMDTATRKSGSLRSHAPT